MEVVVFLAMMIVPFISIAALIISIWAKKRTDALKSVVMQKLSYQERKDTQTFLELAEM